MSLRGWFASATQTRMVALQSEGQRPPGESSQHVQQSPVVVIRSSMEELVRETCWAMKM